MAHARENCKKEMKRKEKGSLKIENSLDKGNMMIEYLNYGKDTKGLIPNVELPKCDNRPSAMLQGNLRADGVV